MLEMAWVLRPGPAVGAAREREPEPETETETRKDHLPKRSAAPVAKSLH
jgi:hypothetical protein